MSRGPERFLFLEFLDPEVNALLSGLRAEFSEAKFSTGIHITVRGPYEGNIPAGDIYKFQKILETAPILIHGVGKFENQSQCVVFIRVSSDALRKVWWKPDYPAEKYGFNPHITLYKGNDSELAEKIYRFLRNEELALICHQFRLTPYAAKQEDMFPLEAAPINKQFLTLSNRRLVKADILQRAANLVRRHKVERLRGGGRTGL